MSDKYGKYASQSHMSSIGWIDDTKSSYKADNGMSCLITVIIVSSLIAAGLFYFGLF